MVLLFEVEPRDDAIINRESVITEEEMEVVETYAEEYRISLEDYLARLDENVEFSELISQLPMDISIEEFEKCDFEHSRATITEKADRKRRITYELIPVEFQDDYITYLWRMTHMSFPGLQDEEKEPYIKPAENALDVGFSIPSPEESFEKASRTIEKYDDFAFEEYE